MVLLNQKKKKKKSIVLLITWRYLWLIVSTSLIAHVIPDFVAHLVLEAVKKKVTCKDHLTNKILINLAFVLFLDDLISRIKKTRYYITKIPNFLLILFISSSLFMNSLNFKMMYTHLVWLQIFLCRARNIWLA